MDELYVHLFHILFVGGLFLYIGIKQTNINKNIFIVLLVLGLSIIGYHIYRYFNGGMKWVNLIHIFIIGPLLVYIGFTKEKTSRKFFEILLMLGFASIGYHAYYLFFNI